MLRHFLLALVSTRVWSFGAPDAAHSDSNNNHDNDIDIGIDNDGIGKREHAWHSVQYADHEAQVEGLTYETFLGPKVSLKVGEVANDIRPIDFIKGPAAIRYFTTMMVDGDGNEVPPEDLYVHHWFLLNSKDHANKTTLAVDDIEMTGSMSMGYCHLDLPGYGTGAELNDQVLLFPRPLAWVVTGDEFWALNQHFIRTEGVGADTIIPCIECPCEDSTPENPHGSHYCNHCLHGAQCWGMEDVDPESETKDYYLKYTIGYEEITDDTVPMAVLSVDGVKKDDGSCAVEYDVKIPRGEDGEDILVTDHMDFPMTQDFNVTLVASHLHVGGVNLTVENWRDGEMEGVVCHTEAEYDSDGMLVGMPFCLYDFDQAYPLKEGDTLRISGSYDTRTVVGSPDVDYHTGVMTLAWLFGHAADREELLEESQAYAVAASKAMQAEAAAAASADNWSPFPGVELKPLTEPDAAEGGEGWDVRARLTCEDGAVWCGFGLNNGPLMDGAIVYTISEGEDGEMALQKRKLGNHNPGELMEVDVSEVTTNEDGSISAEFTMGPLPDDYECSLAAVGSSASFGYHTTNKLAYCPEL